MAGRYKLTEEEKAQRISPWKTSGMRVDFPPGHPKNKLTMLMNQKKGMAQRGKRGRPRLGKVQHTIHLAKEATNRIYSRQLLDPRKMTFSEVIEELAVKHLAPWTWDYAQRDKLNSDGK